MKKYQIAGRELTLCTEPPPKGLAAFASMFGIKSFADLGTDMAVIGKLALRVIDLQLNQRKLDEFLALATDCKGGIMIDDIEQPDVLAEIVFDFFQLVVASQFERVKSSFNSSATAIPGVN